MPRTKRSERESPEAAPRLDRWLWAARFFKTRSLAAAAVSGGHVHLAGARAKPARPVRVGDRLTIVVASVERAVVVRGLSERRGPASVAATLYEETEASVRERERQRALAKAVAAELPPALRPSKRDRRALARLKGRA